jgi:hypothetical protein
MAEANQLIDSKILRVDTLDRIQATSANLHVTALNDKAHEAEMNFGAFCEHIRERSERESSEIKAKYRDIVARFNKIAGAEPDVDDSDIYS